MTEQRVSVTVSALTLRGLLNNPQHGFDAMFQGFYNPYPFFVDYAQPRLLKRLGVQGRAALKEHHPRIPRAILSGVAAESGGLGSRNPALRLVSTRRESDHVGILSRGGTLKSRGKHFTIPFKAAMRGPKKVKTPWDFPSDQTFTTTPKSGSLAGKKVMFLKKVKRKRRTLGQLLRGEKGKVESTQVVPLFRLDKVMTIKGSGWINTAVANTLADVRPAVQKAVALERSRRAKLG